MSGADTVRAWFGRAIPAEQPDDSEQPSGKTPRAWELARSIPAISTSDTAAVAMEAFSWSGSAVLLVIDDQKLLGYLERPDLLALVGGVEAWQQATGSVRDQTCAARVKSFRAAVNGRDSLDAVARALDRAGDPLVPVLADDGRLLGCISATELIGPPERSRRLPPVGGMATPFGVYLTTAGVTGGVGFWALASTGAMMGIRILIAGLLCDFLIQGVNHWSETVPAIGHWLGQWPGAASAGTSLLEFAIFLGMVRFSSLAGFHAAEHQVVHTLEAHEPLAPSRVRSKPRVHPRCGTNIMVLVMMALFLIDYVLASGSAGNASYLVSFGLLFLFLFQQIIGGFVQQHFTTRPATDRQIASGIHAAEELLGNYAATGGRKPSFWRSIWCMGLIQVGFGATLVLQATDLLQRFYHWLVPHLPALHLAWFSLPR